MIKAWLGIAVGLALVVVTALVAVLAAMRSNIAHEDPCSQFKIVLVQC